MRMLLEPQRYDVTGSYTARRCKIIRIDDDGTRGETEIWFKLDKSVPLPQEDDCDAYLLAVVMEAMKENRSLEVKGSVSKQLLSNLVEFQTAWNKWKPTTYSCIDISVDNERCTTEKVPGAICAFSGGVDATFSVWRHSQSKNSHRSQSINLCSIVHGFDIPLCDDDAFEVAKQRAKETLSDIEIDLLPIKTNYRQISNVSWEDSFSAALVATLSNYKVMAGTCIVGSSEPYDYLIFPWGSSPITDHLLSSSDFVVMHDGASHSRTEKVKELSEWKVGVDNLRVCWQETSESQNCGVCEKCIRTKLNFLAAINSIPSCFLDTDILKGLDTVKLSNDAIHAEWRQIYEYAARNKAKGAWVNKLKKVVHTYSLVNSVLPKGTLRRKLIRKLIQREYLL